MKLTNKKLKLIYILSIIIIIFILIYWYSSNLIYHFNHPFEHRFFQSTIIISTRLIATISILYLSHLYNLETKIGKFWLFLGLGLLSKTIGEVIYQYYLVFTDIPAFPSIADIFFLAAYPFWYIAFFIQISIFQVKLSKKEKTIIFWIFTVLCIITFITVVILPIYTIYPLNSENLFLLIIGAAYPICDLVLIICIMILFAKLRYGKINSAWILIFLGFLVYLIANIIFNWLWAVIKIAMGYAIFDALISIGHILIFNGAITVINLTIGSFKEEA